jgi:hypothetical protein
VPRRKWLVLAKNSYMLRTSGFGRFRYVVPLLIGVPVVVGIFAFVSWISGLLLEEVEVFFLSTAAVVLIQIILFTTFILFLFFPISFSLNSGQEEHYEILLSAPLRPKDVILGKFIGDMPLYSVGVVAVSSALVALMLPLGLGVIQGALVTLVFILTFFSALWIGVVIAAMIRSKIGSSTRGKDIGKALSMAVALPMVGLMYALMSGMVYTALLDAGSSGPLPFVLDLLPSSWGADVVVDFAVSPGDASGISLEDMLRVGAMAAFFVGVLWAGGKFADRAYNLESQSMSSNLARQEGAFYRAVRAVSGGGAFGTLVVSVFKDYGRRLENVSKVVYVIGLVALITFFFGDAEDAEGGVIMMFFLLPFLAGFIVGEVTVRGKENLFIYRKAPKGESRLVRARLVQSMLVMAPLTAVATAIPLLTMSGTDTAATYLMVPYMTALSAALVVFSLGLFLMWPVFSEKPADMMGNVMVLSFFMMGCFFVTLFLGLFGEVQGWLLILTVTSISGAVALLLGVRNLRTLE